MKKGWITVVTPTIGRPIEIINRCIRSVGAQHRDYLFQHYICSDGINEQLNERADFLRGTYYYFTSINKGHYGAGIRQWMMDKIDTEFVCFLDDDNVLLPDYFEENMKALAENPEAAFSVSKCFWVHPQNKNFGLILSGVPVKKNNVDTIQCFFRTEAIREHGWLMDGYTSDGATYESMAKKYKYATIDKVLSVHF